MDPHASPFLPLFVYIPPLVAFLMTPDDCCFSLGMCRMFHTLVARLLL